MAESRLNDGATDLSVGANWSDTTGFAAAATLVIAVGTQSIQAGLNQSTVSIESLDVLEGFSGIIGGAGGPLRVDFDGTAEAAATQVSRLRWWSPGTGYIAAGGPDTLAHFVQCRAGNLFLTSGIAKHLHVEGGYIEVGQSLASSSGLWVLTGGSSLINDNATGVADLRYTGGGHTLKRGATSLKVAGSTNLTIDAGGRAITTMEVGGGNVLLLNAGDTGTTAFTTVYLLGGTLDCRKLGRNVTITTLYHAAGATLIGHPRLTITNKAPIGGGATLLL